MERLIQSTIDPPTSNSSGKDKRATILVLPLSDLQKQMTEDETGGSPLGPSNFVHQGMFADHRLPLTGAVFDDSFARLTPVAKANFARTTELLALLRPTRWHDVLTTEQHLHFSWISVPSTWATVQTRVGQALEQLPILALSVQTDPRYNDRPQYISIATYNAVVVTFSLEKLATQVTGWIRRSELIPEVVRKWLFDPNIFVISTGLSKLRSFLVDDILVSQHYDCDDIFLLYQALGVIHPTFPVARVDAAWLLTYATDYHHRPMEEKRFVHMVGQHSFQHWPVHRQPGWRPDSALVPTSAEEHYFFFETTCPFAFLYRLLLHGIVYQGMAAVHPELPFSDLIMEFIKAAGATPEEAEERDPLGLSTDRKAGPPPAPAFPSLENSTQTAVAAASSVTGTFATPAPNPPSRRVVVLSHPVEQRVFSSQEPPDRVGTNAHAGTAPSGVEADLAEMLEISDDRLVDELNESVGEGTATTTPSDHPGYFTTAGLRQEQERREMEERAEPDRLTPQAQEEQQHVRQQQEQQHQKHRRRSREREQRPPPPRPPSVECLGATRQMRAARGPSPAAGGKVAPLGREWANDEEVTQQEFDLRQRLQSGQASTRVDLRHRLSPSGASGPRGGGYLHFDVRSQLNPTANAAGFSAEAAGVVPAAPGGVECIEGSNTSFARRFSSRNRKKAKLIEPELASAPPIDAQNKSNWSLTNSERAWNPYMVQPLPHRRCQVCSSQHCSKFVGASSVPNCVKYREQLALSPRRRICDYRRCRSPQDHFVPACPYLHQRCPRCGCRGHGAEDGCNPHSSGNMRLFREDFEEFADVGLYTKHRATQVAWGFYPIPPEAPRNTHEPFVNYDRLSNMEVLAALAFLESLLIAPENQVNPPAPLDDPSVFDRAGNSGVAPGYPRSSLSSAAAGAAGREPDAGDANNNRK